MLHRIQHRLGWNKGTVVVATDKYGFVWVGFRCTVCGKVSGKHIASCYEPLPPFDAQFT